MKLLATTKLHIVLERPVTGGDQFFTLRHSSGKLTEYGPFPLTMLKDFIDASFVEQDSNDANGNPIYRITKDGQDRFGD